MEKQSKTDRREILAVSLTIAVVRNGHIPSLAEPS
jgi:hypothetical protein